MDRDIHPQPLSLRSFARPLIVFVLAICTYAVCVVGQFAYDDIGAIVQEPRVQDIHRWRGIWTRPYWELSADHLYRPLVSQSYALQWWLTGHNPMPMHVVNILLHGLVSVLVFLLLKRLLNPSAALIGAILFAVHPVHVEAVANIVGRAELMCAAGVVTACLLALNQRLTGGRIVLIALSMMLAILSKEQGYLTPFLLMLVVGTFLRWRRPDEQTKQRLQWLFVVIALVYLANMLVRELYLNIKLTFMQDQIEWTVNPLAHAHGIDRWLLPFTVLGHYARVLFFPSQLHMDYGAYVIGDRLNLRDIYFWIGLLALAGGIVALISAWRRRALDELLCLGGFAVCYYPISHVGSTIGTIMGERLLYLPSVFFVGWVGIVIARFSPRWRWGVMVLIVAGSLVRSISYAWIWNDPMRLYAYAHVHQPRSTQAHGLYCSALKDAGRYDEALKVAQETTRALPNAAAAWILAAKTAMDAKRFDLAEQYLLVVNRLQRPDPYTATLWTRLQQLRATTQPISP